MQENQMTLLDYSKGIWAHNANVDRAKAGDFDTGSDYLSKQETLPGFFDEIINFKFDKRGKLVQREQAITVKPTGGNPYVQIATGRNVYNEGKAPTTLGCSVTATNLILNRIYREPTSGSFVNSASSAVNATAVAALDAGDEYSAAFYAGLWYFYNSTHNQGMTWDPNSGGAGTFTAVADYLFPGGVVFGLTDSLVWRDRVWGFGDNTNDHNLLMYSKATDPTKFAVADGGGFFKLPTAELLVDMIVWNDDLYIMAQSGQVWEFSFTSDPGTDGYLRAITSVGDLSSVGNFAVSNGILYLCDSTNVYALINNRLIPIGDALCLTGDNAVGYHTVIWDIGYGLMVSLYSVASGPLPGINLLYVYHHSQQAWTEYRFQARPSTDTSTYDLDAMLDYRPFQVVNHGVGASFHYDGFTGLYPFVLDRYAEKGEGQLDIREIATGSAVLFYQTPYLKISSGVEYLTESLQRYVKLRAVEFDAYLAYISGSDLSLVPANLLTPFKTTIEYAPSQVSDLVDTGMKILSGNTEYTEPYIFRLAQRVRGFKFTWERIVADYASPAKPVAGLTVASSLIDKIIAHWHPVGTTRNASPSNATSNNVGV